ncbi:FG-GAP-like repeat-containing protein [Paenarthrobacter ureafaciens]
MTSSIDIGAGGILALAVNVKTNKIYFTTVGRYGAGVHVIDGATDTVTDTIPSDTFVGQLAVNPETNTVYVAGDSTSIDGFVQVIDGATKKQVAQLRTASRIRDVVVSPGTNKAYAILSGRGVMVVDGETLRVSSVFTGQEPIDAAVNAATGQVYVANNNSSSVSIIDPDVAAPVKNDFNGDSHSDVLARDGAGVLWLYPGNGSGGWLPRVQVGVGWNVMTALVSPGDFNGDALPDVLARDNSGILWVYPGNGSGGWFPRVAVGQGWNAMTEIVGIGSFYGGGFADVAARDASGTLWLYRGDGRGGWLPRMWIGSGWNGMSELTGVADFNGDGVTDLGARDSSGALWLYPPNGIGGWLPHQADRSGLERDELTGWSRRFRRRRTRRHPCPQRCG